MNTTIRTAALLAATAGTVAAFALTSDAATARAATHTLRLTTHQLQDQIVRGVDIAADKDMQHGRTTGYDVTSCRVNPTTHKAHCKVALARGGGVLLGTATIDVRTGHGSGQVTGGSGSFRSATGTISVALPQVKIVYQN